jgi:predicted O-methyltransferase YrrM
LADSVCDHAAVSTALESESVKDVLERLRLLGEEHNSEYGARVRAREIELGEKLYGLERAEIGAQAPQAVSAEVGRILYALVVALRPRLVVEFGGSFGVSTIYLAAALHDLGRGDLITTEMIQTKAAALSANLTDAGVAAVARVLFGDARDTLAGLSRPVDMLFLDGSNDLYVDILESLKPRFSTGSLIAADLSHGDPHHARYRDYVSDLDSGFLSVEVPVDAGLVISIRL